MKNTAPVVGTVIKRAALIQIVQRLTQGMNLIVITREFDLIIGVGGGVNVHVNLEA